MLSMLPVLLASLLFVFYREPTRRTLAPDDVTVITIQSTFPPDAPLELENDSPITISVTVSACIGAAPCQTVTATVQARNGDTRKEITQRLYDEFQKLLSGNDIVKGDTTITIGHTPSEAAANSGTEEEPNESPSPGDPSDVFAESFTRPLQDD